MKKLYTFLTLFFITASHASTTLPMNGLARAVAQKAPRIALRTTPGLAATPRRLLSAAPNLLALNQLNRSNTSAVAKAMADASTGSVRAEDGSKYNQKQRDFSRPYSWLPALGAATALGLNLNREQAECLTEGYRIFLLNKYAILIMISDCHADSDHLELAINQIEQINTILDCVKKLKNYSVFFNMEFSEGQRNSFKNSYELPLLVICEPLRRAMKHKDQEDNIFYKNFDLRPYGVISFMHEKHYREAKKIAQKACLKVPIEKVLENFISATDLDYSRNIPSDTNLTCNILKQAEEAEKTEKPTIIFSHAGGLHNASANEMLQNLGFQPVTSVGTVTIQQIEEIQARYKSDDFYWTAKEKLFVTFADPIINVIENWPKLAALEKRIAKFTRTMENNYE